MKHQKRIINVNVLPGESTDGTGRVCIHLFVRDENGMFTLPCVINPVMEDGIAQKGKVVAKPTRGRLACDPKRSPLPTTRNGATVITPHSDDPRAVTCYKCKATQEYKKEMEGLGE